MTAREQGVVKWFNDTKKVNGLAPSFTAKRLISANARVKIILLVFSPTL